MTKLLAIPKRAVLGTVMAHLLQTILWRRAQKQERTLSIKHTRQSPVPAALYRMSCLQRYHDAAAGTSFSFVLFASSSVGLSSFSTMPNSVLFSVLSGISFSKAAAIRPTAPKPMATCQDRWSARVCTAITWARVCAESELRNWRSADEYAPAGYEARGHGCVAADGAAGGQLRGPAGVDGAADSDAHMMPKVRKKPQTLVATAVSLSVSWASTAGSKAAMPKPAPKDSTTWKPPRRPCSSSRLGSRRGQSRQ